jgi:hypothetical protein
MEDSQEKMRAAINSIPSELEETVKKSSGWRPFVHRPQEELISKTEEMWQGLQVVTTTLLHEDLNPNFEETSLDTRTENLFEEFDWETLDTRIHVWTT